MCPCKGRITDPASGRSGPFRYVASFYRSSGRVGDRSTHLLARSAWRQLPPALLMRTQGSLFSAAHFPAWLAIFAVRVRREFST